MWTPYDNIFVLKGNSYDQDWLNRKIDELVEVAREQDAGGIKAKLKEIMPEYTPFGLQIADCRLKKKDCRFEEGIYHIQSQI